MKKIVFFIPAIVLGIFIGGFMLVLGFSVISPIAFLWIGLFILSGILLSKRIFWGGMLGVLPGIHLIYMNTVDTGQIMNIEFPLGIMVSVFYLLCCAVVFYGKKQSHNHRVEENN